MSLYDVLLPQVIQLPEPTLIHRCADDPEEEVSEREKKLAAMREYSIEHYAKNKQIKKLKRQIRENRTSQQRIERGVRGES